MALDFGSNCTKAITCDGPIEELNTSYRKQGSRNLEQYCYCKISTENKIWLKKKIILYVQLSFIYVEIASINWIFVKIFSFNNIIDDA